MLIDTHCHINFPTKFPNPEQTIAEAKAVGVTRMIAVGCDPETSRAAVQLAEQFHEVFAVVGWHPTYTKDFTPESLDEIEVMLKHPKVVAIGEIGLDFHWDTSTPSQQLEALHLQLEISDRLDVPVVFHCREAYPELLDILVKQPPRQYLFHCYAGNQEDTNRAMSLGCYFGVDGPISYKNSKELREVIRSIPVDRLVVETDSPYLPPEPYRGKPNCPAYVKLVSAALAATLGINEDECARITTQNAERFFRLPTG